MLLQLLFTLTRALPFARAAACVSTWLGEIVMVPFSFVGFQFLPSSLRARRICPNLHNISRLGFIFTVAFTLSDVARRTSYGGRARLRALVRIIPYLSLKTKLKCCTPAPRESRFKMQCNVHVILQQNVQRATRCARHEARHLFATRTRRTKNSNFEQITEHFPHVQRLPNHVLTHAS